MGGAAHAAPYTLSTVTVVRAHKKGRISFRLDFVLNRKANYFLGTQFNDHSQRARLKAATHGAKFKQHVESNMFPKSCPRQQVAFNKLKVTC